MLRARQGTKAELDEVLYWTSKRKLKPLTNVVLPFSDMVKGHIMMINGEQIGKLITTPQKV